MKAAVALAIAALATCAATARAHAKGCHEHSFVVGFQHCSHFGDWSPDDDSIPRGWVELGAFDHQFTSSPFTLGPAAAEPSTLQTHANGVTLRGLGAIGGRFYTGVEVQFGATHIDSMVVGLDPAYASYAGVLAIGGVHASAAFFGFSAELATGFRYEGFDSCLTMGCTDMTASQTAVALEARVRMAIFLRPHWSVDLAYGQSLVDSSDHQFMLSTALHFRAMDGM